MLQIWPSMDDSSPEKNEFLMEFYIPTYIFIPELPPKQLSHIPSCPVLVFINSKSGGQLGGDMLVTFRKVLNKLQVLNCIKKSMHGGENWQNIVTSEKLCFRFLT